MADDVAVAINPQSLVESDILESLGLGQASHEQRQAVFEKFLACVSERVQLRIEDAVGEEKLEEWNAVMASDDDAKIDAYLKELNISIPDITVEESLRVKAEMMQMVAARGGTQ